MKTLERIWNKIISPNLPLIGQKIKVLSARSTNGASGFEGYIGEVDYSDDFKSIFIKGKNSTLVIAEPHLKNFKWKYEPTT